MEIAFIIPAFIAGLLTFLAPCTLPLVPAYLGFLSGASLDDLRDPTKVSRVRRKIFISGLLFMLGFSVVFILFGTAAGLAGRELLQYRPWLTRIGGIFVILFGLFTLNVLKLPFLQRTFRPSVPRLFERSKPLHSFLLGSTFSFGWTPCVGPILGTVLLLASTANTAAQGALLLAVFSLGLAIPFLLIALGIGQASTAILRLSRYLPIVSVIGGLFLVFLGILLVTDNTRLLVSYGFKLLKFINYDRILDYL